MKANIAPSDTEVRRSQQHLEYDEFQPTANQNFKFNFWRDFESAPNAGQPAVVTRLGSPASPRMVPVDGHTRIPGTGKS